MDSITPFDSQRLSIIHESTGQQFDFTAHYWLDEKSDLIVRAVLDKSSWMSYSLADNNEGILYEIQKKALESNRIDGFNEAIVGFARSID